jgi:hypothetical protein
MLPFRASDQSSWFERDTRDPRFVLNSYHTSWGGGGVRTTRNSFIAPMPREVEDLLLYYLRCCCATWERYEASGQVGHASSSCSHQ